MANTILIESLMDVVLKLINIQIDRRNRALIADKNIGVDLTAYYDTIAVDPFLPMEDLLYHGCWDDVVLAAEKLKAESKAFRENFDVVASETRCLHIQVKPGIKLTKDIRTVVGAERRNYAISRVELERKL